VQETSVPSHDRPGDQGVRCTIAQRPGHPRPGARCSGAGARPCLPADPGQQAGNRHLARMKGRRWLVVADRSTNLAPAEPPVILVLGDSSKSAVLAWYRTELLVTSSRL